MPSLTKQAKPVLFHLLIDFQWRVLHWDLMALIIVVSVMNGLEGQLKQRILGIVPH